MSLCNNNSFHRYYPNTPMDKILSASEIVIERKRLYDLEHKVQDYIDLGVDILTEIASYIHYLIKQPVIVFDMKTLEKIYGKRSGHDMICETEKGREVFSTIVTKMREKGYILELYEEYKFKVTLIEPVSRQAYLNI